MRHNYKDLKVWQKSRSLVREVYSVSSKFPPEERFGVVSQFRRAAISISLNIAEGSGRGTDKDFRNFLHNAFGSSFEVENLIFLCLDLSFIDKAIHDDLLNKVSEIQKMLNALIQKFETPLS
jgi:four helix bundle protein